MRRGTSSPDAEGTPVRIFVSLVVVVTLPGVVMVIGGLLLVGN
jgi:hypothetical protein